MRACGLIGQAKGRRDNRTRNSILGIVAGCALALSVPMGCGGHPTLGEGKPAMDLTSPGIRGGEVQKKFTCDGADVSPELSWSAPPAGTKSFALLMIDPDAPVGEFVHWVLYDLPLEARGLPKGVPKEKELADGSR
jgi:hypothetical protein